MLLAIDVGNSAAAPMPTLVMVGYLLFAATFFSIGVLTVSSWADVLHPQHLAVGGAAINTLWQIGAFLSPYGFGLAKDGTGGFTLGLIVSAAVAGVLALLILYARTRVALGRRMREHTAAQTVALTS